MTAIISTHEMVKDLEAKGFTLPQAEALTAWQVKIAEGTIATKADILEIKTELNGLRKDITHDLTIKALQIQFAGIALTVGILKLIL